DGRSGTVALAVLDHARLAALHDGHAGIRGPEVDADYLSHWFTPQESILCSTSCTCWVLAPTYSSRGNRKKTRGGAGEIAAPCLRPRASATRLGDDYAGRPQQSSIDLVPRLDH